MKTKELVCLLEDPIFSKIGIIKKLDEKKREEKTN
jgi:hypothetical protein